MIQHWVEGMHALHYSRTFSISIFNNSRSLPGRSLLPGSFCYPFARQHLPSAQILEVRKRPGRAPPPGVALLLLRGKLCWTSCPTLWPRWRSLPVAPVSCTQGPEFSRSEHEAVPIHTPCRHSGIAQPRERLTSDAGSYFAVN